MSDPNTPDTISPATDEDGNLLLSAQEADNAVAQYSYAKQGITGYVYLTP